MSKSEAGKGDDPRPMSVSRKTYDENHDKITWGKDSQYYKEKKTQRIMKKNKAELVAILDRSGSMTGFESDTIGGFNSFLNEQRKLDGEANLTLVLFDHDYEKIYDGKDINEVPELDDETYTTRGMTALLDAVGRTIDSVGERLDNMEEDEKPENVIFFILTDGQENSSSDYTRDRVEEMIKHQEEKYSWEFIYGGANQDAFAEAGGLGIKAVNTFNFASTSRGVQASYQNVSKMSSAYRTGKDIDRDELQLDEE